MLYYAHVSLSLRGQQANINRQQAKDIKDPPSFGGTNIKSPVKLVPAQAGIGAIYAPVP